MVLQFKRVLAMFNASIRAALFQSTATAGRVLGSYFQLCPRWVRFL